MSFTTKNYKTDGGDKLVIGGSITPATETQATAIANAKVNYTTGDMDSDAKIIAAFNTTNGKINSILAALRGVGIIAS
jgi:hypothetical protein